MFENRVDIELGHLMHSLLDFETSQSTELLHRTSNSIEKAGIGLSHYVKREALSPTYMFEKRVDVELALLMYSLLTMGRLRVRRYCTRLSFQGEMDASVLFFALLCDSV